MTGGGSSSADGFVAFLTKQGARLLAGVVFERPIYPTFYPFEPPITGTALLPYFA